MPRRQGRRSRGSVMRVGKRSRISNRRFVISAASHSVRRQRGLTSPRHRCGTCLLHPPVFARVRAVGWYRGVLQQVIHAMKYRPIYGLTRPLAELLQQQFDVCWADTSPDVLIPVPLPSQSLATARIRSSLGAGAVSEPRGAYSLRGRSLKAAASYPITSGAQDHTTRSKCSRRL